MLHDNLVESQHQKYRNIIIKVEIDAIDGVSGKELYVKLIDEDSLSFLFCLRINQENFYEIKKQQGLLVDYNAFGQKLVDLFEIRKAEENSSNAKFFLKLYGTGDLTKPSSLSSGWTLDFVESNPLRPFTHLSLRVQYGDADHFRDYLIYCLKKSREESRHLNSTLESTQTSLNQKLQETQNALAQSQASAQQLKINLNEEVENLKRKLEQQVTKDSEKLQETETYFRNKHDQERRDMEANFASNTRVLESKIQEFERTNKCLCDENSKLECDLRDMKVRHESLNESYHSAGQDIQGLRRAKEQVDRGSHELECQNHKLSTRVEVLEQEVRDKDQFANRIQDQLTSEQENRLRYYEDCQKKTRQVEKLEKVVKNLNAEVSKGNEIIQKLQNQMKEAHSKVKVRTQIAIEQEKVIAEHDKQLRQLNSQISGLEQELHSKTEEFEQCSEELKAVNKKMEDANHVIKTDKAHSTDHSNPKSTETNLTQSHQLSYSFPQNCFQVISWLNSQVIQQKPASTTGVNPYTGVDPLTKYRPQTPQTRALPTSWPQSEKPTDGKLNYLGSTLKHHQQQRQQYSSSPITAVGCKITGASEPLDVSDSLPQQSLTSAYFPRAIAKPK